MDQYLLIIAVENDRVVKVDAKPIQVISFSADTPVKKTDILIIKYT